MRSTLDKLISWTGLLLALVLLIAGGLLTWASSFIGDEVHSQLTSQKITMPTEKTGLADLPKADREALEPYAGKQLSTGPMAKAYAEHYILVHMKEGAAGKTYSEVSGQYMQLGCSDPAKAATVPDCAKLGGTRQMLFMGDTLRGLLLYGHAFATIGTIAMYAAIAAFVGAVALLLLALLGLRHAKQAAAA